ncbi:MAG: NAD(P)-binding domain-containing protein [Desulfobacter sp.]
MEKIGIIGAGRMGSYITRKIATHYSVYVYDVVWEKASALSLTTGCNAVQQIDEITSCDCILLAVGKKESLDYINQFLILNCPSFVVCLATEVIQEDLYPARRSGFPMFTVKIIGESDEMEKGGASYFIVNNLSDYDSGEIINLLSHCGTIIEGDDAPFESVNLVAAEEIMMAAGKITGRLKQMGIPARIIQTAIQSVSAGTLAQYPWEERDYFHKRIFNAHPELKQTILLENSEK